MFLTNTSALADGFFIPLIYGFASIGANGFVVYHFILRKLKTA